MTEKLKTLLHEQAETVDFAVPDLDSLTRTGDRRIRRRRGLSLVGGVAALALVGGMAATQLSGDDSAGPGVANDPVPGLGTRADVAWATGHVIHVGDRTVDVGHPVTAFVRTSAGFVVADPQGTVWSVVSGDVSEIGHVAANRPRLVSDPAGSRAGWVEVEDAAAPRPMVYDQSTGAWSSSGAAISEQGAPPDERDRTKFYAIDGDTAYWRDTRGTVAVDLTTADTEVIDAATLNGVEILDVENGVIATDAYDEGTRLGVAGGSQVLLPEVYGSLGVLSPDAEYYSSDADEPEVYDARNGQRVPLDLDYAFATGYEWLSDDQLAVIAQETPTSSVQLLTCRVPEGSCEVVVDGLGSFDDLTAEGFSLPVGEQVGD
jgi:hypothetical protein